MKRRSMDGIVGGWLALAGIRIGPDSALEEWRIPLRGAAQFYRLHLDEY